MQLFFVEHVRTQPPFVVLLLSLGFLSLLRASVRFLRWVYSAFLRPSKSLSNYGSWALVTGATDGIGKAFALQLAQKGLHLVLVGRSPTKLWRVSEEIKARCNHTNVKTVVIDLAASDLDSLVRSLREDIAGLDIGILVNNAGTTYPRPMYFDEVEEELWRAIVRVNVEGTTMVTQAVLPGMLARRRGAVVNIGSGASVVVPSFPLSAVYAATKAYIDQFSRSLYVEYKSMGIDVQCQIPLYVATKMISTTQSSILTPSPERYVDAAMHWIGNDLRCTPYWPHSIQWWVASLLSESILNSLCLRLSLSKRTKINSFQKE